MNPLARHFLPSVMRGVYRFDDDLPGDAAGYRQFVERKLRFLPKDVADQIRQWSSTGDEFLEAESQRESFKGLAGRESERRAADFFRQCPYFQNAVSGDRPAATGKVEGAENFLEVQFVRHILAPLLTCEGLHRVYPQRPVGRYRVDFAIMGATNFALETDGFGKFKTAADLDNFLKRQNDITAAGWKVIRFTYSQVMHTAEATRRDLHRILGADPQLAPMVNGRPGLDLFSAAENFHGNVIDRVNDFHRGQDQFVDFCLTSHSDADRIAIRDGFGLDYPFVAVAISTLYEWLEAVAGVIDLDFDLPEITVCGSRVPPAGAGNLHARVMVQAGAQDCGLTMDTTSILRGAATVPLPPAVNSRGIQFRKGLSLDEIHLRLSYFTHHLFGYSGGTKRFQDRVLQRIFDGKNVLGIAATGSGKSFCFWLPALLKPGLTLVIAPLRSLMRDQNLSLRNYGIATAAFINSDVDEPIRRRILEEAKLGFIRILYISPERLRIKKFLDELEGLMQSVPLNILAIDEAHCISEWGHDFRPSYLKLPLLCEWLSQGDSRMQLIALTATAGREVEADMRGILRFKSGEDDDLIREPNSADRERFSYQVVIARNGADKTELFHDILNRSLPTALWQPSLTALVRRANQRGEKAVGMVFCIYADPHGRHSTREGTAHFLYEAMSILEPERRFEPLRRSRKKYRLDAYSTSRVRVFSSKPPTHCPHCNSYDYSSQGSSPPRRDSAFEERGEAEGDAGTDRAGVKICAHCGKNFNGRNALSPPTWEKTIKANQDSFKRGDFDILVATKGFGMGIDKSSVRFVVHTALASGLESWYQEIGRAGRDNERAHIVLLTEPPTAECYKALAAMEGSKRPNCNYTKGCGFGKTGLCDYGKQHMFITRSYPGAETDAFGALSMLDKLIAARLTIAEGPVTLSTSNSRQSFDELAIYRLSVLGLVRDYLITYDSGPRFVVDFTLLDIPDSPEALSQMEGQLDMRLEEYLKHFPGSVVAKDGVEKGIAQCREIYRPLDAFPAKLATLPALNQFTPLFDDTASKFLPVIYEHLLLLLDHTYQDVVKMRYTMLWELLSVATTKDCRRKGFLGYFRDSLEPDYKCGACDVCKQDLQFPDIRIPPKGGTTNAEMERLLDQQYANDPASLDLKVMRLLTSEFAAYRVTKYRHAQSVLAGSPNNLSALFISREFSPPEELDGNARGLLRTANRFRIGLVDVKDLYETSPTHLKTDMLLSILNEVYSSCNTVDGWEFLAHESAKPEHRHNKTVAMMGDCLAFFVVTDRVLSQEVGKLKRKTDELEAAFYA